MSRSLQQPVIETRELSLYYGRQRGTHQLDLAVQPGEVFGYLGPNGAGKTTTLRVLLDILRPTRGQAHIFGLDCQKEGVQIRRRVGYVPGELNLYSQMRADQYLDMVEAVRGKADPGYRRQLCQRLDLNPRRVMRTYSRGNKQKVGLVAAFMSQPDLLILDEPTSGLDPLVQQTVLELVREARAAGRTVFFSSHILPEVQAVCDRVGIIREGELVATESVEHLTRRQFHRLRLNLESLPPEDLFEIEGVQEIARSGRDLTLEIRSNLNEVFTRAARHGIQDVEIFPVTLEEVFLAFYGPERKDNHA
jgi:ABC-2 type transport system ATP-binding protein